LDAVTVILAVFCAYAAQPNAVQQNSVRIRMFMCFIGSKGKTVLPKQGGVKIVPIYVTRSGICSGCLFSVIREHINAVFQSINRATTVNSLFDYRLFP